MPNLLSRVPEVFFGIRTRTFGHGEKFKQRSLFVMNHVCHFDWLFFWGVMERNGNIGTWKVVTKNSIKKVPFVGGWSLPLSTEWAHQAVAHLCYDVFISGD